MNTNSQIEDALRSTLEQLPTSLLSTGELKILSFQLSERFSMVMFQAVFDALEEPRRSEVKLLLKNSKTRAAALEKLAHWSEEFPEQVEQKLIGAQALVVRHYLNEVAEQA